MTTAERTARLWLRAYPRRWRFAYGEDLVGTLVDLAGPGAATVRLRDGFSVLWAGWSLRLREHPPLLPWLRYRIVESDLPEQYRVWMIDDLLGRLHAARAFAQIMVVFAVVYGAFSLATWDVQILVRGFQVWPAYLVVGAATLVVMPRVRARKVWRKHVSGWLPPELRPRRERPEATRELAEFRASTGYESVPHSLREP